MNLTEIEYSVIARAAVSDAGIRLQAPKIKVQRREHTGVGLYTHFEPITVSIEERAEKIGPAYQYRLFSDALPHGGGVIVWVSEAGIADCLEFYSHIEDFPEQEFKATIE